MALIHLLNNQLYQNISSVVYEQPPAVWEMFCSPESQLTEHVIQEGLHGRRINLASGFDLYKDKTYQDLQRLWRVHPPKKCWVSPPCTHYCDWSELNYKYRWEELLQKRRREKSMHKKLMRFLLENLRGHPEVELYWEWPRRCRGWKEAHMLEFQDMIQKHLGREVYFCKLDGCRFGLKSDNGNHIQKSWTILTTDQIFYNRFRLQVCLKNHQHEHIQGVETSKSAYYPVSMCKAIARDWRKQLIPERWLSYLWTAPVINDSFAELYAGDIHPEVPAGDALAVPPGVAPDAPDQDQEGLDQEADPGEPSAEDREKWRVQLVRFHRAAGHPTSRNMARMLADAQLPRWKIQECLNYRCPVCEEVKPGGISSKQVSPASVHELPEPWEQLGIDVAEWEVPGINAKVKFVLLMDMATRYKVTEVLFETKHGEIKVESANDMVRVVTLRWLADKPRPKWIIPDNAKSLTAKRFEEFMGDLGIAVGFPPAHESWAHGLVERGIQQVKETANAIHISMPDQPPALTLALATSAVNSTEYVKGFSSLQWTFGRQAEITDEELRQQLALPVDRQQDSFFRLMSQRQRAEECARKARAQLVLSKLRNTSVRQPLRSYGPAELVMVWRKFLPLEFHTGKRGGVKRTAKARWIGPGRVVLHELVPGHGDEDRKSIVWVTVGSQLFRRSVHSVRPLSEREHAVHEATNREQVLWRQLSDMLPRREFVDIEHEEPQEGDREEPYLPDLPPARPVPQRPRVRFTIKSPMDDQGRPVKSVNDYGNPSASSSSQTSVSAPGPEVPLGDPMDELGNDLPDPISLPSRRSSITSTTPLTDRGEIEPESKRARYASDADDLESETYLEAKHQQIIEELDAGYLMNIEIVLDSNRQRKQFLAAPHLFLAKKMSGAEVQYRKLNDEDRRLFKNAKNSEVSSFLRTEAIRRCLNWEEEQEARRSGRVLKSRWVLVWKGVPEESREEALHDHVNNPNTTYNKNGTKKAKARIVVLGYQHPDLLSPSMSTTAPVQCQLTRNLSFCVAAQRGWQLESLDMSTAFLQTGKTEEPRRIWMHGVDELNEALGAAPHEVLRILKNVYGNATAPRGLWEDVDRTMQSLGARRVIGDASFWIFTAPTPQPRNECDVEILLGYIGGHVDDFQRAGDLSDPRWLEIRNAIDKAYKWGSVKVNNFRYTGLDISVKDFGNERYIEVDQNYYTEGIPDLSVDPHRLQKADDTPLTPAEFSACRAGLGALQWVATQTQLQACARTNLLLSQLNDKGDLATAKEIQDLIKEIRANPVSLKFWHLSQVSHWQDCTIVTLADQAHANRPNGDSTGGLITFVGGPEHLQGEAGRLSVVSWRTWKLRRKAISTNDGEVQSMVEGESANYRARFMWAQINGCPPGKQLLDGANNIMKYVHGLVGTDSKGGFDAITKSEGPLLGLTNFRSALQAFQLRDQLKDGNARLIWLSGDWNLSDALTKKPSTARQGVMQFLRNFIWKLHYDPQFITSERKGKKSGRGALQQMRELQSLVYS